MKNKKAVEWLYQELPELVEKEIIPAESVDLIKTHFGPVDENLTSRTFFTAFSIIGVMLVGLGSILILAHNWDQLSRSTRLLIIISKLIIAQILVGTALWYKKDNPIWTEGSSTFLMLMIGSSMALIGQTYHLADDFSAFILVWMLLSLPLIYLMKATTPATLYLIGITAWAVSGNVQGLEKHFIWGLIALSLPHYWQLVKTSRYGNPTTIFTWVLTICFYICFGVAFAKNMGSLALLIYAALFAATFFVGILWFDDNIKNWRKPFKVFGSVGGLYLSFMLTFKSTWIHLGLRPSPAKPGEYLLAVTLLALVIGLTVISVRRNRHKLSLFSAFPLVIAVGYFLHYFDASGISSTVLLNTYVLLLSLNIITRGVREGSLGRLNTGMLMMALLITVRFLDISFSFVTRGLIFVLLGACFLIANLIMMRRKNEVNK